MPISARSAQRSIRRLGCCSRAARRSCGRPDWKQCRAFVRLDGMSKASTAEAERIAAELKKATEARAEIRKFALTVLTSVMAKYTFTHPADAADCDIVRKEIQAQLPPGMHCECWHRFSHVIARVYDDAGMSVADKTSDVQGYVAGEHK